MRWLIGGVFVAALVLGVQVVRTTWAPASAAPEQMAEARVASVKQIDNKTLDVLRGQGVAIVDVRRPEEWTATGVIEGATLLTAFDGFGQPVAGFVEKFQALAGPETPVAIVCRSGNRSGLVADALTGGMGYTTVYNLAEGMLGWLAAGNPVVHP